MEPLFKRIQTVRLELNMAQADFGAELGVTRSRYAAIERGEFVPGEEFLKSLEERFGVNLEWLRTGKGVIFEGDAQKLKDEYAVPVVNTGSDEKTREVICFPGLPEKLRALRIKDESMFPLLRCGDYVVFKDAGEIRDEPAVIRTNWDQLIVRRLGCRNSRTYLIPENDEYDTLEMQADVHEVIGRVLGVVRLLRLD